MLNRRDQLPESQTASVSGSLWHFLSPRADVCSEKRKTPLTVMAYMSFRGEFPTQDFCQRVLDRGIELILPSQIRTLSSTPAAYTISMN